MVDRNPSSQARARESGLWLGWILHKHWGGGVQRRGGKAKDMEVGIKVHFQAFSQQAHLMMVFTHHGLLFIQGQTVSSIQAHPHPEDTQFHPSKIFK